MIRNTIFFLIVFCNLLLLNAQQVQFNSLGVEDGLSQHDVSSILQDSEGFLWIGTYDGLNRFDGYDIENFFHDNYNSASLSSNRIQTLFEDHKKRIWIGTDGYGLNYYSMLDGTMHRVETPKNYNIIKDISLSNTNELLVATTEGLLKVYEEANNNEQFTVEVLQTPLTGFNVRHICKLKNGSIIYATNSGLWLQKGERFQLIENSSDQSFNWVIQTKNDAIWVGGQNGLSTIVDNQWFSKQNLLSGIVLSIAEGTKNDMWISTFDKGLFRLDYTSSTLSKVKASNPQNQYNLDHNTLPLVFKDQTNTLWVANKKGILYSNLDTNGFNSLPIAKKGHIRTLFANDEVVYYGYQSDRFYAHSLSEKSNKAIQLPQNTKPFIIDTLNGAIHLGTTRGLYRQHKNEKERFDLVPIFKDRRDKTTIFTSFCQDEYGNQFFGTFRGLILKSKEYTGWIYDKYKNLDELRHVRIFRLKFDTDDNCVWVGTISEGLFKINLASNGSIISIENFNEQMSGSYRIPNNSIWSFYKNQNGDLYIGTDTGLLVKKKNNNSFQPIELPNILNKKIMGILEDNQGQIWLNNSQGIIKYNPIEHKTTTYNQNNGLLTSSFTEAIAKNDNGQLFFGSITGINYLNSSKLSINPYVSNTVFTDLIINNKRIAVNEENYGSVLLRKRLNLSEKITLNYKQNDFAIGYSSSNYSNVKTNSYRYKLEGYDDQWNVVDNSNRKAKYANIPDGTYTLLVEATNPNGQWSNKIRSLTITVLPAPWNTWWAYVIYGLVSLLIIAAFINILMNRQQLKNQIAISNLKNEQEKEINEMKLIFFTDVAHEFKTPLSLVIGPLNDLIKGKITQEHKEFCYNIISRNTGRMMNLVNQLLDFRKISSGVNVIQVSRNDMSLFIREIAKSFEWQAKTAKINFNIIAPESYFCHFDRDILEKVIYNLLSNAFKYTPNEGIVEIEIKPTWKQDLEYFVILIKDSGKGIKQEDKKRIFERYFHGKDRSSSGIGLHLTAKLIEAHKGEINVLNSAFGGTEFMISLPVSSKAYSEDEYLIKEDIPKNIPSDYVPGDIILTADVENDTNKEKVLLVEDDFDLRKYLKNTLSLKYSVFEASNGKEGLDIAQKEIPDLVVSDVMMPEMDGIELCQHLKKNKFTSHIPILMLTAKTGDEFYTKGIEVGAWDYIAKPFDSTQLIGKINNILETRNNFRQHLAIGSVSEVQDHYVSYDQKFVINIRKIIKKNLANSNYTVETLSKEIGLSRMQLHRKLKSLTGHSTTAFINSMRIEVAIAMFDNGCDRVQEAMDAIGVNSNAHFIRLFRKEKGITPSQYIEEAKKLV